MVQMAREACVIGVGGPEADRIPNISSADGLSVTARRTMTRFTGMPGRTVFCVLLHNMMWVAQECIENVFVAGLTYLGADVLGRF